MALLSERLVVSLYGRLRLVTPPESVDIAVGSLPPDELAELRRILGVPLPDRNRAGPGMTLPPPRLVHLRAANRPEARRDARDRFLVWTECGLEVDVAMVDTEGPVECPHCRVVEDGLVRLCR